MRWVVAKKVQVFDFQKVGLAQLKEVSVTAHELFPFFPYLLHPKPQFHEPFL
jgi:hypothetical protein